MIAINNGAISFVVGATPSVMPAIMECTESTIIRTYGSMLAAAEEEGVEVNRAVVP